MNKVTAVKVVILLLSITVAIGPIIFALGRYDWNVQALFTPSYSPPKIDFFMEAAGVRAEGTLLYATFKLVNRGEVEVEFVELSGSVYGPDDVALAPASLDKSVVSPPNSTKNLVMKISLDPYAINRLKSYFEEQNQVTLEVRCEVSVRVFGSSVTVPFTTPFRINAGDILSSLLGGGNLEIG
ncbi:hypothetical protein H5T51_03315 [Candidatus Bathyarchaeota archaeon]|nr:hypothetical protein [Candidatus Bathyarchaeota archaeon]